MSRHVILRNPVILKDGKIPEDETPEDGTEVVGGVIKNERPRRLEDGDRPIENRKTRSAGLRTAFTALKRDEGALELPTPIQSDPPALPKIQNIKNGEKEVSNNRIDPNPTNLEICPLCGGAKPKQIVPRNGDQPYKPIVCNLCHSKYVIYKEAANERREKPLNLRQWVLQHIDIPKFGNEVGQAYQKWQRLKNRLQAAQVLLRQQNKPAQVIQVMPTPQ